MNATMVNGWTNIGKIISKILKEINLIINIENKVTGAPAHLADPLKMYSCFIRIREKFSHSNYVDGDPNTGSMYLHGFNGDYYQRWAPSDYKC